MDGAVASHDSVNLLSERISEYTGVAAGATRTLAGAVGATILGLLKRHLTQQNGQVGQLPTLLGHQLPVVRANMTDAFAQALRLGPVGGFLAGVASRLKAVSSHLEHPATQEASAFPLQSDLYPAPQTDEAQPKQSSRKWIWVANAAALALLAALVARGCSTADKPKEDAVDAQADTSAAAVSSAIATDSASASAADAGASASEQASSPAFMPTLMPGKDALASVSVDAAGVPTLKATVGTDEERQHLIDELSSKLGADKFHAKVTVDPDTKPSAWIGKLDKLFARLHAARRERADYRRHDSARWRRRRRKARLDGQAQGAVRRGLERREGACSRRRGLGFGFGAGLGFYARFRGFRFGEFDGMRGPAIARMLNLKPINFRTGSNTPPAAAMAALAKSAETLKECDARATPIKLQIAGYSDNTGEAALNVQLSKKRAESVRAYLVKHGIPANSLTAVGFGEAHPIADNATPAGRMANRRIEFKQLN